RLKNVDDQVFSLYTQAGNPCITSAVMALYKQLAHCSEAQATIGHSKENTDQSQGQEGVDAIPHVPDPGVHGVTCHTIGSCTTNPGSGDTGCNQPQSHATTANGPVIRVFVAFGEIQADQHNKCQIYKNGNARQIHGNPPRIFLVIVWPGASCWWSSPRWSLAGSLIVSIVCSLVNFYLSREDDSSGQNADVLQNLAGNVDPGRD